MKICVDFDGTLVKNKYPKIGTEVPFAFDSLKKLRDEYNCKFILFTMRSDKELKEAIDYCKDKGIEFDYVNDYPPQSSWTNSRKIDADFYIDDKNAGTPLIYPRSKNPPYIDWYVLLPMITSELEKLK